MKTTKKILTLVLALALIFALAAPSFAIVSGNQPHATGNTYYVQSSNSDYYVNGQITVYLHIRSFAYPAAGPIDKVYDVTLGTATGTNQLFTVEDVLNAADDKYSNLIFTISSTFNQQYNAYDSTVNGVKDTQVAFLQSFNAAILYKDNTAYACNYMFRINGMIPYFTHYNINNVPKTEGCLINNAYVTDGDVIDLYYANVYSQTYSTKVRKIVYETPTGQSPYFQLLEADCSWDGDPDHDWVLSQWTPVVSTTVSIVYDYTSTSITTGTDGKFSFTVTSGTHSFKVLTTDTPYQTYNNFTYQVPLIAGMLSVFNF